MSQCYGQFDSIYRNYHKTKITQTNEKKWLFVVQKEIAEL